MKPLFTFVALFACPAWATGTLQIVSITPSVHQPQGIGATITWTAKIKDSATNGRPMFQFSVSAPQGPYVIVKDYNAGTSSEGIWTSQPFVWTPAGIEGLYHIHIAFKDFTSGATAAKTIQYQITSLVGGGMPVVKATANPLVALFSSPSCATGSSMRVSFIKQGGTGSATNTNWMPCHPPHSMTFEIAGMYPNTAYEMTPQTMTGSTTVNGATLTFTSGLLPTTIPFPDPTALVASGPNTDTTDSYLYQSIGRDTSFANVATDLTGKIMWYYYSSDSSHRDLLTHPLANGNLLAIEDGLAWNPTEEKSQLLRVVDLAGNVLQETNTGIIQQQLVAKGATDAGSCATIAKPAPVGSGCLGSFHHDFIQTLPNGDMAAIADVEKIFPPGTQGDASGLPVDIIGDILVVLNKNLQVVWYFDAFAQLDVNRKAVLGETCVVNQGGCPPVFLLGTGIAPQAKDWLHGNSIYYWPQDSALLFSMRHQDWVVKIDYNNGKGAGDVLWTMGPNGDFTMNSTATWAWFSHQHDVSVQNNGAGPLALLDNGNTRVSAPPIGLGPGDSRGMALTVDETNKVVTPLISVDLGYFSYALGSAQLLYNGNYLFLDGLVLPTPTRPVSYTEQIQPTAGTVTGTQVLELKGPEEYRVWQMPDLYNPPTT